MPYIGTENKNLLVMSHSYHKVYSYTCGIKPNTDYYRSCGRKLRREHKDMLRYALDHGPLEAVDELLYHIPKRAVYDIMGAPHDYEFFETKLSLSNKIENLFVKEDHHKCHVPDVRSYLIIRSRLKGYPLHSRKKYSFKECEDALYSSLLCQLVKTRKSSWKVLR